MAMKKAVPVRRPLKREPTHPGSSCGRCSRIEDERVPGGPVLGVSRQLLHRILAGQAAVTPEMAVPTG